MATYTKEKDVETTAEDDSQAREAMREVFGNTARWPTGYAGFTADVVVNIDGKEETGSVTVKNAKDIETTLTEGAGRDFVKENLASIASHRGPRSFDESDGKYKLQFDDDGRHPLGRKLILGGDGMSSFYRIKDGRIHQINRSTPRMSFTINVEESVKTVDDKYLTHKYTVYYFDPKSGGLKDVESYSDDYTRVGEADLPLYRRIIGAETGKIAVNSMTLANHKNL